MREFKIVAEWGNSPINWQQDCRQKLNIIIRAFNQWQREDYPDEQVHKLLFDIQEGIETIGSRDGGEGYREELEGMQNYVFENRIIHYKKKIQASNL